MIRIRMGIDHKPQVSGAYIQLGEARQDQIIDVLGASRIQEESAVLTAEERQIQRSAPDLTFQEKDAIE
jgi:hypothetical protein